MTTACRIPSRNRPGFRYATIPALRQLQELGQVADQVVGRRHEFQLTAAGQKRLADWRKDLSQNGGTESDSTLRAAFLHGLLTGKRDRATAMLRKAAKTRRRTAEAKRAQPAELAENFATTIR